MARMPSSSLDPKLQQQVMVCIEQIDIIRRLLDLGNQREAHALAQMTLATLRQLRREALMPWSHMVRGAMAGVFLRTPPGVASRLMNAALGFGIGWWVGHALQVDSVRDIDYLVDNLASITDELEQRAAAEAADATPPPQDPASPAPEGAPSA